MIGKVAILSQCGLYRYFLSRIWDADLPAVLFIMLNPSTADADVDDATIRKCIGFAKRWGCGAIHVVNMFAYRATDPRELVKLRSSHDPWAQEGPENSAHIRRALAIAKNSGGLVVVAWGHQPKMVLGDGPRWLMRKLEVTDIEVQCLGFTKASHQPRHPLMLPYTTPLEPWP